MAKRKHLDKITDRLLDAHESIEDLRGVSGTEGLLGAVKNVMSEKAWSEHTAKIERVKSKLTQLENILQKASKLRPSMSSHHSLELVNIITTFQGIRDMFIKTNRISISQIEMLNDIYKKGKRIYVRYK